MAQISSVYLFTLVFLYYQNAADARAIFSYFDKSLGKPITDMAHTYDDDCSINFKTIKENLDHYACSHLIGWFLSALILRDMPLLHIWSILDEVLELSF